MNKYVGTILFTFAATVTLELVALQPKVPELHDPPPNFSQYMSPTNNLPPALTTISPSASVSPSQEAFD